MRFQRTSKEERRDRQIMVLSLLGGIAIIVIIFVFGLNILTGFSILLEKIRGESKEQTLVTADILPPTLFPISEASKSAGIYLEGQTYPKSTLIIFINSQEAKQTTIDDTGDFSISIGDLLKEGDNNISAKTKLDENKISSFSNKIDILIKTKPPKLEIINPEDGIKITSADNNLDIKGSTEEDAKVSVNDHIVLIKSDLSFNYNFTMSEGENNITITAVDKAGNKSTIQRKIFYQK